MDLAQQPPRQQKTRTADFETAGFKVPFDVVRRSGGTRGTLECTHSPRTCFGWRKASS